MGVDTNMRTKSITSLLNGTNKALQTVVPLDYSISKPVLDKGHLFVRYGVFIGITGDIKGKLVLIGEKDLFSSIGQVMFGTEVKDDMLISFSGELGNMIAGNLSTHVVEDGLNIDITAPSVITGEAKIQGHNLGIQLTSTFEDIGDLDIHLLLDE